MTRCGLSVRSAFGADYICIVFSAVLKMFDWKYDFGFRIAANALYDRKEIGVR